MKNTLKNNLYYCPKHPRVNCNIIQAYSINIKKSEKQNFVIIFDSVRHCSSSRFLKCFFLENASNGTHCY